jgi:hypothetical protein
MANWRIVLACAAGALILASCGGGGTPVVTTSPTGPAPQTTTPVPSVTAPTTTGDSPAPTGSLPASPTGLETTPTDTESAEGVVAGTAQITTTGLDPEFDGSLPIDPDAPNLVDPIGYVALTYREASGATGFLVLGTVAEGDTTLTQDSSAGLVLRIGADIYDSGSSKGGSCALTIETLTATEVTGRFDCTGISSARAETPIDFLGRFSATRTG